MAPDLTVIQAAVRDRECYFTDTGNAKMEKRGLTLEHLDAAICKDRPEIIEDVPDDPRGAKCLVLGWIDLVTPLHVLFGYSDEPGGSIDILTLYEPDPERWYNYRRRR